MAYLRELEVKCAACKTARATVQLIDRWNGTLGSYCRPCGKKALAKQQRYENTN